MEMMCFFCGGSWQKHETPITYIEGLKQKIYQQPNQGNHWIWTLFIFI